MRRHFTPFLFAMLAVTVGCGSSNPSFTDRDAAPDLPVAADIVNVTDTTVTDLGGFDIVTQTDVNSMDGSTGLDASTEDGDVPEDDGFSEDLGGPYNPCQTTSVINLNTAGTRSGTTTTYTGNNTSVGGMSPLTTMCTSSTGHEVVLSYTPTASTVLRVSTDNSGTTSTFDTVLWVQSACSATSGTELGCNDDNGDSSSSLEYASTLETTVVPAGTPVFIVVAGYTPSSEPGTLSETGTYVLTVTELPSVALGGTCDLTGATNYCVANSSCQGSTTGTCIANGALNGACNTAPSTPACNTGLGCSDAEVCVPITAAGGPCVTDGEDGGTRGVTVCATGSSCQMAATSMLCVTDGTLYGACLPTAPTCASGLVCNADGLCVMGVALGAACDPMGVSPLCAVPNQCVTTGATSVCTAPPYLATNLPTPTWIDACGTGTHVMLKDIDATNPRDDNHSATAITMPFAVRFFGTSTTQMWPDTNGFVAMGPTEPTSDSISDPIPSLTDPALLAPLWEDLILGAAPSSDICYITSGTAPNRQFAVEWLNAGLVDLPDASLTFEAVLTETTNTVDFLYNSLSDSGITSPLLDGASASIGLQTLNGAQYVDYMGTVSTTTGIRFTPN